MRLLPLVVLLSGCANVPDKLEIWKTLTLVESDDVTVMVYQEVDGVECSAYVIDSIPAISSWNEDQGQFTKTLVIHTDTGFYFHLGCTPDARFTTDEWEYASLGIERDQCYSDYGGEPDCFEVEVWLREE